VRSSLAGTAPAAPETVEHSSPPTPQELMERSVRRLRTWLRVWQGATAAAVAAALALLVYQGLLAQRPPPVQLLAVLQPVTARAAWLIQARADGATVRPISAPPLPSDRSFELWLVPSTGTPVSLGLLSGERATVLDLGPALRRRLLPDSLLAVSIEPSGGSRTGAPTGPVVYSGRLTSLALGPDGGGGGNASRGSQSLPTQLTTPQQRQ
jgi:anti-sigma-K factor RskA